jgi:hypothetical protein
MATESPQPWKMPPLMKVYEAIGVIGDRRVTFENDHRAKVLSSDGRKTYLVEIADDGRTVSSNDNASYWQGYLGYPAIAVMLLRGLSHVREDVISTLSGIPWKELNTRFRNDYAQTIAEVMERAQKRGADPAVIAAEAEAVLSALRELAPLRAARRRPPRAISR